MNNKFFRKLLIDWSAPLTLVCVVLALWGAFASRGIELKLSLTDLLPSDHPSVIKFNRLTEIVGGVGYVEILLHAEDGQSHLKLADRVVEGMKANPLVRSAFYHREEHFFLTHALYYADMPKLLNIESTVTRGIRDAKRRIFDIGLWDDEVKTEAPKFDPEFKRFAERAARLSFNLTSPDGKDLLIMVKPNFDSLDMGKSKQLVEFTEKTLREIVAGSPVTTHIAGRYVSKVKDSEVIEKDIFVLGILANVVMALILLLYFRSIRAVISIFTPVVLGLGITALLTRYVIGHVNVITGFLAGMLAGVGSDYGIHLLWRIRLEQFDLPQAWSVNPYTHATPFRAIIKIHSLRKRQQPWMTKSVRAHLPPH